MNIVKRIPNSKRRTSTISLPAWVVVSAVIVSVMAAGQAVGPAISGAITGGMGLTIEQSLTIGTDSSIVVAPNGDANITKNDDGSIVTLAIEMTAGDTSTIKLDVDNSGNTIAIGVLSMVLPPGIEVDVESSGSSIEEAQLSRLSWLVRVPSQTTDTLNISLRALRTSPVGFYTARFTIVQISSEGEAPSGSTLPGSTLPGSTLPGSTLPSPP